MLAKKMTGKRKCIVSWTRWVDIEKLKSLIGNRKLYIWGKDESGKYVTSFLNKNKIRVEGYIDNIQDTYAPEEILPSQNLFIIVAVADYCADIFFKLEKYGYQQNEDYLYLYHKIEISSCSYYSDSFGNQVIGQFADKKSGFTVGMGGGGKNSNPGIWEQSPNRGWI